MPLELRTVIPPCPVCAATARDPVQRASPLGLARCQSCGLHYTSPRYDPDNQTRFYVSAYNDAWLAHYERNLAPGLHRLYRAGLERLGPPVGKLLDLGAGTGDFVNLARAAGWDAQGLEPHPEMAARARQAGLPVAATGWDTAAFADGEFAAITMWDVLEHLADPVGALRQTAAWLRPGGRLLLRVPDFSSWLAPGPAPFAAAYRRWLYPLDLNQHLSHFTPADLERLLAAAGLALVSVTADPAGEPFAATGEWWERLARRLTGYGARRLGLRTEMTVLARKPEPRP